MKRVAIGSLAVAVVAGATWAVLAGERAGTPATDPPAATLAVEATTSAPPGSAPATSPALTPPPTNPASTSPASTSPASTSPASTVPGPTISTPTTLPPVDDPDLGTTEDEPVPLGESVNVGEWRIGVTAAELDGTATILDFVPFNEPPREGSQFVVIELTGIYQGGSFVEPVFDWELVGETDSYSMESCGVVPSSVYDVGGMGNGSQFTANVCFEVSSAAVEAGLVLTLGLFDSLGGETFFALE